MDFELDLSSENMTSFLELEQEIKEAATMSLPPPLPRPSVIVKPRAREKKKSEQDLAEEELEALADRNSQLHEKLGQMETEFKYLKKLMVEAGLGKYTLAVNY